MMIPLNAPPRTSVPIIQRLVAVYKVWHEFLPHISKDVRYTLGIKIDGLMIEATELVFVASYLGKDQKSSYIQRATAKMDLIKFFLQVLWEIKALDNKKYIALSEKFNEIGRMLGGWARQLAK